MIDLGKYAVTVLSAYGVSLSVLAALIALTWRKNARSKARLAQLEAKRDA